MTNACHDDEYLALLSRILEEGSVKGDRTGTGTRSLFGAQLRFDLSAGFPLLTTKKLPFRWIAEELFWFLSGSTNEGDLRAKGVNIWKEWATEEQCARFGRKEGDLGPVYGHQWRNYGASQWLVAPEGATEPPYKKDGIDQIAAALDLLANNPDSRRIIVNGWNPQEATKVALPPCHTLFQFGTHEELFSDEQSAVTRRVLNCHMYQRSADVFLGVPFNIASYALLTHMFAYVLGYDVGDLVISFGDVHIYQNHVKQVNEQLWRRPRPSPTLAIDRVPHRGDIPELLNPLQELLGITYDDLRLSGYDPLSKIKAEVSV